MKDCEEVKRRHNEHEKQRYLDLKIKDLETFLLPLTRLRSEYGFVNVEHFAVALQQEWEKLPVPNIPDVKRACRCFDTLFLAHADEASISPLSNGLGRA